MSGFPPAFQPPAFEIASLRIPFGGAIVIIGLGILPFLLGWMFQRSRFAASLCLIFSAVGVVLSTRYGAMISIRGYAHGLVDRGGTFDHLPIALAFEAPGFALGMLTELVLRRRRERRDAMRGFRDSAMAEWHAASATAS